MLHRAACSMVPLGARAGPAGRLVHSRAVLGRAWAVLGMPQSVWTQGLHVKGVLSSEFQENPGDVCSPVQYRNARNGGSAVHVHRTLSRY